MKDNRNLHQESPVPKEPIADSRSVEVNSNKKTTPKGKKLNSLISFCLRLVAYYPWLPITALLLVFFGSGAIALYSLGYVGQGRKHAAESDTQQVEIVKPIPPASSQPENSNAIPMWMSFAIALSCAGGCILILQLIRGASQPQAKSKTINRYQARMAKRQRTSTQVRQVPKKSLVVPPQPRNLHQKPFVVNRPTSRPVNRPTYINRSFSNQKPNHSNSMKPKPLSKVIPSVPNQSANSRGESLADSLDLRKQSPLSSILRRY